MIKIAIHGCCGAMGRVIASMAAQEDGIEIVAGIDRMGKVPYTYPVFSSLKDWNGQADVIVDFSAAPAVDELLNFCEEKKMPVVLCTTGLSESQKKRVAEAAKFAPILWSANMSLGINLLLKLVAEAAKVLTEAGFDMEIVEKHHNQKKDAPSGTALALADALNQAMDQAYHNVFDRSHSREKRDPREIGISSVRGGTIVGEHDVIFAGTDEVITISHTAYSKAIFAKGALAAAKFLADKPAGLYSMSDVIE